MPTHPRTPVSFDRPTVKQDAPRPLRGVRGVVVFARPAWCWGGAADQGQPDRVFTAPTGGSDSVKRSRSGATKERREDSSLHGASGRHAAACESSSASTSSIGSIPRAAARAFTVSNVGFVATSLHILDTAVWLTPDCLASSAWLQRPAFIASLSFPAANFILVTPYLSGLDSSPVSLASRERANP